MGHRDGTTVPVFSRYSKLRVFLFGRIKVMEIGCRCITTHAEESQSFASEADYIIANMDNGQFFRIITDCFNKSVEAIIKSKGNAVKNTGKYSIVKFGKHTGEFIINNL